MSARTLPLLGVDADDEADEVVFASLSHPESCDSKVALDLVYQLPLWLAWRT
jgi:hypothetical protein